MLVCEEPYINYGVHAVELHLHVAAVALSAFLLLDQDLLLLLVTHNSIFQVAGLFFEQINLSRLLFLDGG